MSGNSRLTATPSWYSWGVDCSGYGAAVAVVFDGRYKSSRTWHDKTHSVPERLRRARQAAITELHDLSIVMRAGSIAVEQPVGRIPNPTLMAMFGVMSEAATRHTRGGATLLTPPMWRGPIGFSRAADHPEYFDLMSEGRKRPLPQDHWARKPDKRKAMGIAREAGYTEWDDNVADATCIALANEVREAKLAQAVAA